MHRRGLRVLYLKNKGKCLYDIRNYSLLSEIKLGDIYPIIKT